jgi:hypothetical protein
MLNREKIIIFLMLMVVAFGGYNFFFDTDNQTLVTSSRQSLAELKKFVIDAATNLSNEYISTADKYIIDQAEKVWPQDPFLKAAAPLTSEPFQASAEVTVQTVQMYYTGYLQTSDKQIAIVNGNEYETGEQLSDAGYYVKRIMPNKIILGIDNSSDTITVPLDEPVNVSLE